jgi:hypothetical protein
MVLFLRNETSVMAIIRFVKTMDVTLLNQQQAESTEGSKGTVTSRNICVGFADVTRASGVNLKFAYDVRHV